MPKSSSMTRQHVVRSRGGPLRTGGRPHALACASPLRATGCSTHHESTARRFTHSTRAGRGGDHQAHAPEGPNPSPCVSDPTKRPSLHAPEPGPKAGRGSAQQAAQQQQPSTFHADPCQGLGSRLAVGLATIATTATALLGSATPSVALPSPPVHPDGGATMEWASSSASFSKNSSSGGSSAGITSTSLHWDTPNPDASALLNPRLGLAVDALASSALGAGSFLAPSLQPQAPPLQAAAMQAAWGAGAAGASTFAAPSLQLPPIPSEFPPLPAVQEPQYTEVVLPNGLKVLLVEDHEVPLIRGTLLMRGGRFYSPADKVPLASVAAAIQRTGGSTQHPSSDLDARLEDLAAVMEVAAGNLAISADFVCMREDAGEVLGLLSEVVRSPALPDDKVEFYKDQLYNLISHQNDDPSSVAYRMLQQLLYGPESVYARQATRTSVESITRQDVKSYLATWERPETSILGLVGDFNSAEMAELAKQRLGDWAPSGDTRGTAQQQQQQQQRQRQWAGSVSGLSRGAGAPALGSSGAASGEVAGVQQALPPWWSPAGTLGLGSTGGNGTAAGTAAGTADSASPLGSWLSRGVPEADAPLGKVFVVDRPGVLQASVALGEPGVSLKDPDAYALEVLGGMYNGFGGSLFNEVRSRQGLAYSVSAGWESPLEHPGTFTAMAQTSYPGQLLARLREVLAPGVAVAATPDAAQQGGNSRPATPATPGDKLQAPLPRMPDMPLGPFNAPPARELTASNSPSNSPGNSLAVMAAVAQQPQAPAWPDAGEVAASKARLLNGWVFNSASRAVVLQRALVCELLGEPRDLLARMQKGLQAVGPDEVRAAAARHLHPDAQVVVVVGDGATIETSLKAAGFDTLIPLPLPSTD